MVDFLNKINSITDINNVIAIVSLSVSLVLSIIFDQKDICLMLGGAIGGFLTSKKGV